MVEWPDDDDDDNGDDDFCMRRRVLSLLKCSQLLAAGFTSAKFSNKSSGILVGARSDIMLMLDIQVRSDTNGCGPAPTSSHSKDHPTTPTVPKFQTAPPPRVHFHPPFVENAMLVFFLEARRLAPTKQVENWPDPSRAVLGTNARTFPSSPHMQLLAAGCTSARI